MLWDWGGEVKCLKAGKGVTRRAGEEEVQMGQVSPSRHEYDSLSRHSSL